MWPYEDRNTGKGQDKREEGINQHTTPSSLQGQTLFPSAQQDATPPAIFPPLCALFSFSFQIDTFQMSVGDVGAKSNGRRPKKLKDLIFAVKLLPGKLGTLPCAENGEFMSGSSGHLLC